MQQAFAAMTRLRADPVAARQRLRATIRLLRERHPDLPQLAIGFCLGGFAVLEMARDSQNLAAVVCSCRVTVFKQRRRGAHYYINKLHVQRNTCLSWSSMLRHVVLTHSPSHAFTLSLT